MKKFLFSILVILSFSLSATPSSETSYAADDDDVIEIDVSYIPPVTGPKRTPAIVPITVTCYLNLSVFSVCFLYDIGDVDVIITNTTYGTYTSHKIPSSVGVIIIPYLMSSGNYIISFTTMEGVSYSGQFIIS